jgi:hypothetical protein
MQSVANELYRQIWERVGAPLADEVEQINCTRNEFVAGYDYALGIDVIFKFANGTTQTLQEKFLTTTFYTLTVEYMQDWRNGVEGDWFNMRCQLYFVGYYDKENIDDGFYKYALVDWAQLLRHNIVWNERQNQRDGARSSFRYLPFDKIPDRCSIEMCK